MRNATYLCIPLLACAVPGWAQMVSYEADSFPEDMGWERGDRPRLCERWLDAGWLHFECETLDENPCGGEDDFYRWELDDWAGVPRFFLEAHLITDGPNSELIAVAPASLVASGSSGIRFHTTVSRDLAVFVWNPDFRGPYVPLDPETSHVFRIDVYGPFWFEWSVDGVIHDWGSVGRQYPTADSVVQWGARAFCFDSVTAFDYVRFGVPDEPTIDCDAVRKLKARCRERRGGEGKLVAKVRTRLDEGTELTLTNNGDHRSLVIDARGRATAKYKHQSGDHTVLLLNCPGISQELACGD